MKYDKWLKLNTHNLTSKTAVITGSTGGLGVEICATLTKLNCNLILLNRNLDKSNKQKDLLFAKFANYCIFRYSIQSLTPPQIKTFKIKYYIFTYCYIS